ncbi:MAG: hypothetical protein IPK04_22815 [Bdellovibrionales bacterium]|nr:hypothetical protein [Bdellovibrionales bacterium]
MTPRLKNSKKWTAFPPDLTTQIGNSFQLQFKKESKEAVSRLKEEYFQQKYCSALDTLRKAASSSPIWKFP